MKIAILILAHKNPEQLQRLVDALKQDFEIFIHFDKNSAIETFLKEEDRVHILRKRYATSWGSYRIILAEIALLKEALLHNCDYFILISGQDIPIMNNKALIDHVKASYKDYVDYHELPTAFWGKHGGKERLHYYWANSTGDKTIIGSLSKLFFYAVRRMQMALNINRTLNFTLYGGSQWLNLRKESVAYILSFLEKNNWYLKRYKYTRAADELFFQTILLSFSFKDKLAIINDHKRYIDWTSGPEYPKILRLTDYENIIHSGAFFARKFDEHTDAEIINKLMPPSKN